MRSFTVAAFYKFVDLPDFEQIRLPLLKTCRENQILGTILVAAEGINGTIAGDKDNLQQVLAFMHTLPGLADLEFRYSKASEQPFHRMKVKLKKEIVTLGVAGIDPTRKTGEYVEPSDWNQLISDPEVLVIDTRNSYEVAIGTFEGAVDPETPSFRDFPDWLEQQDIPKDRKVAMFCTGGIRCEKSTAFLLKQGFEHVYHLKGGILNYLEQVEPSDSLWKGQCFVFDERVSVGHGLEEGGYELCRGCRRPLSEEDKRSPHYEKGVSCPACYMHSTVEQKNGFRERQKQVEIAETLEINHIGEAQSG